MSKISVSTSIKNSIETEVVESRRMQQNNSSLHSLIRKEAELERGIMNFKLRNKSELRKKAKRIPGGTGVMNTDSTDFLGGGSVSDANLMALANLQNLLVHNRSVENPEEMKKKKEEAQAFIKRLNEEK